MVLFYSFRTLQSFTTFAFCDLLICQHLFHFSDKITNRCFSSLKLFWLILFQNELFLEKIDCDVVSDGYFDWNFIEFNCRWKWTWTGCRSAKRIAGFGCYLHSCKEGEDWKNEVCLSAADVCLFVIHFPIHFTQKNFSFSKAFSWQFWTYRSIQKFD